MNDLLMRLAQKIWLDQHRMNVKDQLYGQHVTYRLNRLKLPG